jgi:surfeit locus 1 family protein
VNPRWQKVFVLVVALLAVWLTASLGFWQLRRADLKLARQATVVARDKLPALDNKSLPCDDQGWAQQLHRQVVLKGHWMPQYTWLLDNRAMDGRAGFYVVTALRLENAVCRAQVLLVQRGWIPRNAQDRTQVPPFETPDGPVQLRGRLMPEPSRVFSLGTDTTSHSGSGPDIVQNIDLTAWPVHLGEPVLGGVVLQLQPEVSEPQVTLSGPSVFSLLRDWPVPTSDVGKHHAYAAQWFAMAALITGLYVWFQLINPLRHRTH